MSQEEVWINEFGIYLSRALCPNGCYNTIYKKNFCDSEVNHEKFGVWEINDKVSFSKEGNSLSKSKPVCCKCNHEKLDIY